MGALEPSFGLVGSLLHSGPAPVIFPLRGTGAGEAPALVRRWAAEWNTNAEAVRIIKNAEKLRLRAYRLAGQWLVGYGHAGDTGPEAVVTPAKAEALLIADVGSCEGAVADAVMVPVTRNEFSALVAFCYNIGSANMARSVTLHRLNHGDRQGAADAFLYWRRATIGDEPKVANSLVERRRKERALFLSGQSRQTRSETPTS